MKKHSGYYSTSQAAQAVGLHPNTVRLYETIGYLPTITRNQRGYRVFTDFHIEQLKLIRIITLSHTAGGSIRLSSLETVLKSAARDFNSAMQALKRHRECTMREKAIAMQALEAVDEWANRREETAFSENWYSVTQACELLDVSADRLRNWERNGLIRVERHPKTGYRRYCEPDIGRLRIIRTLLSARYGMNAIRRLMTEFDRGKRSDLDRILDTPPPWEEICSIADRWITGLNTIESNARKALRQLNKMRRMFGECN